MVLAKPLIGDAVSGQVYPGQPEDATAARMKHKGRGHFALFMSGSWTSWDACFTTEAHQFFWGGLNLSRNCLLSPQKG